MQPSVGTPAAFSKWRRRLAIYGAPAVLGLFVLVMLWSMEQRRRSTARVQATYARLAELHEVAVRLVDAETGQRGFLITGDSQYLQPFYQAERDVSASLTVLMQAYAENPRRFAMTLRLDSLADRRFRIMALPIAARIRGGAEAARVQLIAGRGRQAMDELRAELAGIERAERVQLAAERSAQARAGLIVLVVLIAGSALVLVTAVLTNQQFQRYTAELERVYAEQRELNDRLQEQATELEMQAVELETSNEELIHQQAQVEALAAELESSNEELQATNAALEERTQEAEAANVAKSQFLANMSHELRTPLNAVAGYVDLLELGVHGPVSDEQRADLARIRHNNRHLLLLITDILNFAKVKSGRLELRDDAVALPGLIAEVEQMVRPMVDAREITFLCEEPETALVRGDGDRIRQILLNLVSNAVKFTPAGGSIYVKARTSADQVQISVADTGLGIPEDMQESVFDAFVQVKRGPGGELSDGVGLGLSISRELARAMGGEISLQSAPGKGSVFTLSLPRGAVVLGGDGGTEAATR